MINSAYSESSNSSRFNPILQKHYEMICEIIVSKMVCGIFLIFCRSSFFDNFIVKNNFSEPQNHPNLNIWRSIYLKKFPHTVLKIISAQISWKSFFRKNLFSKTWSFFRDCKTTGLGLIFFHKKCILYFFFFFCLVWFFSFNIISKTYFKNFFRKTVKN